VTLNSGALRLAPPPPLFPTHQLAQIPFLRWGRPDLGTSTLIEFAHFGRESVIVIVLPACVCVTR